MQLFMNQQCKVCGEPAAGFHFGAFTCEGCKSFFGRSYNNLSTIAECKNNGDCEINKKNRTACKACRLKKCLFVGMSKSGSRYGRRSNWFKIHCLLQEQQQQQQQQSHHYQPSTSSQQLQLSQQQLKPINSPIGGHNSQRRDEAHLLGLDDYKNSNSPSVSSPESHNSENSVEVSERRAAFVGHPGFRPLHPQHMQHSIADLSVLSKEMINLPLSFHFGNMPLLPPAFLPPPNLPMFPHYHICPTPPALAHQASNILRHSPVIEVNDVATTAPAATATAARRDDVATTSVNDKEPCRSSSSSSSSSNNNDNGNYDQDIHSVQPAGEYDSSPLDNKERFKRFYLDTILKRQQTSAGKSPTSLKQSSERGSSVEGERSPERGSPVSSPELNYPTPQVDPIDLSVKKTATNHRDDSRKKKKEEEKNESDSDEECSVPRKPHPMDLTTKP